MNLQTLIEAVRPVSVAGAADVEIKGLAYDSRQVRPGWLFVALPGEHADGRAFVADAVARGAVAVLSEAAEPPGRKIAHVVVADARQAAAEAAGAYHRHPSRRLALAGVTGTNGKTTTTYMIRQALEDAGLRPGLVGTVEYRIGERVIPASRTTPQALDLQAMLDQMAQAGCRSAAMEVSSHAVAQKRVWGIELDVAVFTNLTHDHLDYHRTMEAYFEAKADLFRALGRGEKKGAAAINIDDAWGRRLLGLVPPGVPVLTYGCAVDASVRADGVRLAASGSAFRLVTPAGSAEVRLRLLGRYNVSNALAAAAACAAMGLTPEATAQSLGRLGAVPGRLESFASPAGFSVFVDYAHTDDALSNVLTTLREITAGRLIVVFGCGGNRDRTKRPAMGAVAAQLADYSILTSDNPRKESPAAIIAEIRGGFGDRRHFDVVEDRAEAIRRGVGMARAGDAVLVAGKGHEPFQEFANTVVPFDDREVVRGLLG